MAGACGGAFAPNAPSWIRHCALVLYYVSPGAPIAWCPTTTKLTSMIERVHSKKLPLSCASKLSFTVTEGHGYHAAIQVYRSVNDYLPSYYLLNIFQYSKDVISYCRH